VDDIIIRLEKYRTDNNLTGTALAALLEIRPNHYSDMKAGRKKLSEKALKIAESLLGTDQSHVENSNSDLEVRAAEKIVEAISPILDAFNKEGKGSQSKPFKLPEISVGGTKVDAYAVMRKSGGRLSRKR
jgi:plasmid maintenance system antidote protein VapI